MEATGLEKIAERQGVEMTEQLNLKAKMEDYERKRFERKLQKKDKKILGLQKRIRNLEKIAADRSFNLSKTIEDSIKHVLANVRIIPILGLGSNAKIIEIKTEDLPKHK